MCEAAEVSCYVLYYDLFTTDTCCFQTETRAERVSDVTIPVAAAGSAPGCPRCASCRGSVSVPRRDPGSDRSRFRRGFADDADPDAPTSPPSSPRRRVAVWPWSGLVIYLERASQVTLQSTVGANAGDLSLRLTAESAEVLLKVLSSNRVQHTEHIRHSTHSPGSLLP